ncbi:hypothetical protein A2954_04300 [Candidatus Roizmanbacteria bacterium RIFCSPLOWO2_01_FULL_37_12]|uniref:LytR/CpsA/Psr regulator C-terminal domain-containing protein n=1 Tax=Candidatus Roizmanbacteria bacterium RIFCSPLOWO2_01_FULL_37_12 TaxID=1802056 RepID=A0A1F7IFS1_9BACT|nr:MAG: hypothetical protein A3D76_06210 [Candidatus Roizmanbacteria bacterium RIFCSPHIGHO2_02_FULL_37_9b]OGK42205.1 MAG: hypothetical protein A2954_04300 [Candidatus Roizmanbacteria bacterium RIFCSPLOWO2_01_FULL_37_12]
MKKEKLKKIQKISRVKLFYFLIVVLTFYFLFFNLRSSAFFQKKDRINLVFSEDKIAFYSLGLADKINYFISFYPDLEMVVPGGYGYYRLGALAKLASLEKNPDLFKKTYSVATSSIVDYYFYTNASVDQMEIFFGKKSSDFSLPRFSLLFFGESNAHFFDRIYLYLQFLGKTKGQFNTINSLTTESQGNRKAFSPNDFFETFQGILYKTTYRKENRSVQIVYTRSYNTALQLGRILEGEGIRVVDLNQNDERIKKCKVIEDSEKYTETAKSISRFFGCQLSAGKTEAYDIILKLGNAEGEWAVE